MLRGHHYICIWWNFIASSPERIEEAKAEWLARN
jgi:redox-sensitive bicupin YhaK (pirin superfamily)